MAPNSRFSIESSHTIALDCVESGSLKDLWSLQSSQASQCLHNSHSFCNMADLQALQSATDSLHSGLEALEQRRWTLASQFMTQCLLSVKPFLLSGPDSFESNLMTLQSTTISFHQLSGYDITDCPLKASVLTHQPNQRDFTAVTFVVIYNLALVHQQLALQDKRESLARKAVVLFESAHSLYVDEHLQVPVTIELSILYNLARTHLYVGNSPQHQMWMRSLFDTVMAAESSDEDALTFFHAIVMSYFFDISSITAAAA